ncbi:MAG: DUF1684 domain-containing protein [Flavobacteriales bacterium]
MRIIIISVILCYSGILTAQLSYEEELQKHRTEAQLAFEDPEQSILTVEEREAFHGLEFFSLDKSYKVPVKFKLIKKGKVIGFTTSTDRIAKYRPYGKLKFKVNGKRCKLTVFESAVALKGYENHLFLPFTDLTNGLETYGGGRYLDLSKPDMKKKFLLDFNYCYNPYCAYSSKYSCPAPPEMNRLEVEIRAGVKGGGH